MTTFAESTLPDTGYPVISISPTMSSASSSTVAAQEEPPPATSAAARAAPSVVTYGEILTPQVTTTASAAVSASSSTAGGGGEGSSVKQCAGCGGDIHERYLLYAVDLFWHTGCLRCSECRTPLAEVGATCFTRSGMILCRDDYFRLFGATGSCSACGQLIGPSEMVLRTSTSSQSHQSTTSSSLSGTSTSSAVYHVQCFACAACHCRLVAGDRYRVVNGHVICGDHDFSSTSTAIRTTLFQHHQQRPQPPAPGPFVTGGQLVAMTPGGPAPKGKPGCDGSQSNMGVVTSAAPHQSSRARQKAC